MSAPRPPDAETGSRQYGFDPAALYPRLTAEQLGLLRQVGGHWRRAVGGPATWRRALPVRTDLVAAPPRRGGGRFTHVGFAPSDRRGELIATEDVLEPDTRAGRLLLACRRAALGAPLRTAAVTHERMRKLIALPILSSDALSSVAYGPQAMLVALAAAGTSALGATLPIAAAIAFLMVAVGLSYRQTVRAYPGGGGSYIVASDNLGEIPGLLAAAGLMIDYVLTVSVSVAAGIAAVTSAAPSLQSLTVPLGVGVIALLLVGNLRGVREAGSIFAWPTYAFLVAIALIVATGLARLAGRGFVPVAPPPLRVTATLGTFLILRAFASGATAMTGIEAISNAIPAFKPPEWRNARATLTWMIALLVSLFAGIVVLIHFDGIVPLSRQTVLSQIAHASVGHGVLYGYVQVATALILLLAANTAFNDFPRLLYFMARDRRAPMIFLRMGDRLAFYNGIIALAVLAAVTYVGLRGNTEALIPLYAVGVFLAFSLSQAGMVVHWWRLRGPHWRRSTAFNAVGCVMSGAVLVVSGVTKFVHGAWIVVLAVPALMFLFKQIHGYYEMVGEAVALRPIDDSSDLHDRRRRLSPRRPAGAAADAFRAASDANANANAGARGPGAASGADESPVPEVEESPEEVRNLALVPVAALDRPTMRTLAYAASLGQPVLAVHISPDDAEAGRFEQYWRAWGDHLPLEVVVSPYRAIVVPLARYIEALHSQRPDMTISVILPELVPARAWQRLLHGGIASRLRRSLAHRPRIVVTTVPFLLPRQLRHRDR